VTGSGQCGHVNRPDAVTSRQQNPPTLDVLADGADVATGRDGIVNLYSTVVEVPDVFAHDHGVTPVRHQVAGVNEVELPG
jgi:hypothetical protein